MKDKVRVAFINPPHADWSLPQTMTFLSMESHYNVHGKYPDRVEWIEPPYKWNTYTTADDVYEEVKDADVFLFSSYIWNYNLVDEIATTIRKRKNKEKQGVILLLGGPHIGFNEPDFYEKRGGYDFILQPTTPGEPFMVDFIDALINPTMKIEAEYLSFEVRSTKKTSWEFISESIYEQHFDYLKKICDYADEHDLEKFVVLETTRGCPFKCVYCEWGGGLGTKILKKPLDTVKRDIDALKLAGYSDVYLTDANFGVFKERDREILEYSSERGIKLTDISVVKTKDLEKRKQLVDMFDDLKLDWDLHIPVQTISDQALKDAKRLDLSIEDKIELGKYIKNRAEKHGMISPGLEMIMAMPGSTLDDFYNEFDLLYDFDALTDHRYDYMVFPDCDAADPDYITQHNIELVDVYSDNIDEDNVEHVSPLYKDRRTYFKTMSSSYSYTQEEMCEMYFMNFAGPQLIEDHYDTYESEFKVSTFVKFAYDACTKIPGYEYIMSEIRDIYDPATKPKNINTIHGMERTRAITNFVKNSKLLLSATLFEVIYE